MRRDGNCFYRALGFALLERIQQTLGQGGEELLDSFLGRLDDSKQVWARPLSPLLPLHDFSCGFLVEHPAVAAGAFCGGFRSRDSQWGESF